MKALFARPFFAFFFCLPNVRLPPPLSRHTRIAGVVSAVPPFVVTSRTQAQPLADKRKRRRPASKKHSHPFLSCSIFSHFVHTLAGGTLVTSSTTGGPCFLLSVFVSAVLLLSVSSPSERFARACQRGNSSITEARLTAGFALCSSSFVCAAQQHACRFRLLVLSPFYSPPLAFSVVVRH